MEHLRYVASSVKALCEKILSHSSSRSRLGSGPILCISIITAAHTVEQRQYEACGARCHTNGHDLAPLDAPSALVLQGSSSCKTLPPGRQHMLATTACCWCSADTTSGSEDNRKKVNALLALPPLPDAVLPPKLGQTEYFVHVTFYQCMAGCPAPCRHGQRTPRSPITAGSLHNTCSNVTIRMLKHLLRRAA
mgnify:FL=1